MLWRLHPLLHRSVPSPGLRDTEDTELHLPLPLHSPLLPTAQTAGDYSRLNTVTSICLLA